MRITPLDIRKQEFRKTMRGLDADEVYAFLTTVAEEYEAVLSDNKKLRERIVDLEERLKEYKNIETNLRNTLLTAERVTSEAKENARKEASLIVRGAEVEANKAAEAIRAHTQQLRREILELKRQKDNYMTRFRTLLESHHRVLDGFEEEYATVDREIEEIGKKVEADLDKGTSNRRMSRQKITEEFGHAAKDKVTWEEERRREEEPRPTMPRPGLSPEASPGDERPRDGEDMSGEDMNASQQVSEAQTSLLTDEDVYRPERVDAEPVASMDEAPSRAEAPPRAAGGPEASPGGGAPRADAPATGFPGAEAPPRTEAPAGSFRSAEAPPRTESVDPAVAGGPGGARAVMERGGDEVRRSVARGIEAQLYPQPGESTGEVEDDGSAQAEPEAGAEEKPQRPAAPAQQEEDQWRKYEFRGEKTNWKEYDIPAAGQQEPPPKKKAVKQQDDSEFEEALSGLKEIQKPAEKPSEKPQAESAEKVVTLDKEAPAAGKAPPEKAAPQKQPSAHKPISDEAGSEEGEWSMDDLRKNLSNFTRDEANKG